MRIQAGSCQREIEPGETMSARVDWHEVRDAFVACFGGGEPRVFFAPGRVNLIGEHVDYNGGRVLPVPIDLGVHAAVRARADDLWRVSSTTQTERGEVSGAALADLRPVRAWLDYPFGALKMLARRAPLRRGADLLLLGTVPPGAGLSSSAALLVATLAAASAIAGVPLAREEIAQLALRAETEFVGVPCGGMDQMVSALGESGRALLIDFRAGTRELVALPPVMSLLVFDSRTRHQLTSGGYRDRVAESQSALSLLRQNDSGLDSLGALTPDQLARVASRLPEVEGKRVRHVVGEIARVTRCVTALRAGDLPAAGRLLNESHASCRDDYEVSTEHLDLLQEAAVAGPEVYGARLTGAGFGGSVLALARAGSEQAAIARVTQRYRDRFGFAPDVHRLAPSGVLHELAPVS
jgi:galactokinase